MLSWSCCLCSRILLGAFTLQTIIHLTITALFSFLHQSVLIFMFLFCFCSFILVFFIPHLSENTQYLSLTSFTWHNILKVYPYCHKLQDLILLMAKQYCIVYLYSKSSTVKQALFQECIGKSTLFISPT